MAKTADEGWARFELELRRRSTAELANELRLEGTLITAWKSGRARPRFSEFPLISAALFAGDPTRLAQIMGLVPDGDANLESLTRGYIESLRLDGLIEQRRELLRSTPAESAARIVSAAVQTGRWAVAVWPAFEGPPGCKLHVSDRLDFRRTDGGKADEASLRADLGKYLDEFNVVRTAPPPRPRYDDAPATDPASTPEQWSAYRFLADRPPVNEVVDSEVTSIAVVASSVHAWSADCAAILSRILGFGLVSTRSLAVQARQGPRADPEALALRLQFHQRLLADPPHHSVWHHFGHFGDDVSQFLPDVSKASWPRGLFVVRLEETAELLDFASADAARRALFDHEQATLSRAIAQLPPRSILELPVDQPLAPDGSELTLPDRRNARLAQALRVAGTATKTLQERGLLKREELEARIKNDTDPDRRQIFDWLRCEGIL